MDLWVIGSLNQIFIRGFYTPIKFQTNKLVGGKTPFFVISHFVLILFVLTLALDRAVLNGNVAFTIILFSTKRCF